MRARVRVNSKVDRTIGDGRDDSSMSKASWAGGMKKNWR